MAVIPKTAFMFGAFLYLLSQEDKDQKKEEEEKAPEFETQFDQNIAMVEENEALTQAQQTTTVTPEVVPEQPQFVRTEIGPNTITPTPRQTQPAPPPSFNDPIIEEDLRTAPRPRFNRGRGGPI